MTALFIATWILPRGTQYRLTSSQFLAGDLLRSLNGTWIKDSDHLWKRNRRKFRIVAGVRKGKKHDYPWPDNVDPNTKAPLTYLSYFKPLAEKPKPVTLEFEKPLIDFEQKIVEVQRMAGDTGLDFTDQINARNSRIR